MDENTTVETGAPMPEEKSSMSSILSIVLIVVVLAAGAFYFFKQVPAPEGAELNTPAELQSDATLTDISTQGTSTDIADIEADLNATDFSGVDAGLSDLGI